MLDNYYKPFEDFENSIYDKIFTRVIKEDVKQDQLIWHKDKKDRDIKVVYGTGWKLQNDNKHFYYVSCLMYNIKTIFIN